MWVWRGLGFEQVAELPSVALGALGGRCRVAANTDAGQAGLSSASSQADHSGSSAELSLRDERGNVVELGPLTVAAMAGDHTTGNLTGTWRLAPLGGLRLCVPGAVELGPAPRAAVLDAHGGTFSSIREALSRLIGRGGGSFTYRVPTADLRLREDVSYECSHVPVPGDFPLCVVGMVLGAVLKISVTLTPGGSPNGSASRPSLPPVFRSLQDADAVSVLGNGFQLRIAQRGGPLVDPSKIHGRDEEGVAHELERWAKKMLAGRPNSWRPLHVTTKQGALESPGGTGRRNTDHKLPFNMIASGGRQLGDIALAAAANAEILLEPFELSYGIAHVNSMRKMLEDEIANVLSISSEQVMCGDFVQRGQGPHRRHLCRGTITLRFALVNSELLEAVRARELPRRESTSGGLGPASTPKPGNTDGKRLSGPRTPGGGLANMTLRDAGATVAESLAVMKDRSLSRSHSEPSLKQQDAKSKFAELPPDQLLKRLLSTLKDGRHPMRKHPEVFPMLSRIVRGGVYPTVLLVAGQEVIRPGEVQEGLKMLMKGRRLKGQDTQIDFETLTKLSTMRMEVLELYEKPDGELLAQKQELARLSPKDLLEAMEASFAKPKIFAGCLETLVEKTREDVDFCLRLRLHKVIERTMFVMDRFKSDRYAIHKCLCVLAQLMYKDVGCIDRALDKQTAPDVITALANFTRDQPIQILGLKVLKKFFLRAREMSVHGPRIVVLGKGLDELWTFQGVDRLLEAMRLFQSDAEIQLECCATLVSLGELLQNNGMAPEVFRILSDVMQQHRHRPDILSCGVLIIARLGPCFLAHEHRGVRTIVDVMAQHRSNVELQRVGSRALFTLSRQEDTLKHCCSGGCVGAVFAAMCAHSKDAQVFQEGTRALEKHCPRALARAFRVCGDIATVLPALTWTSEPLDAFSTPHVDFSHLKATEDLPPALLESFISDLSAKRQQGSADDAQAVLDGANSGLNSLSGYRHAGLRDDLDAEEAFWAVPGTAPLSLVSRNGGHDVLQRDLEALKRMDCDLTVLRAPGPSADQIKKLCEALDDGLTKKHYGPQDGELLAVMLGHFAWLSAGHAHDVITFGGAAALVAWMKASRFTKQRNPDDNILAYPMKRACLAALSCLCRHDDECANAVLALEGASLAMDYTSHGDIGVRRTALRVLARLIPRASSRPLKQERVPAERLWPVILRDLHDDDEPIRTAAAACALEAVCDGWVSTTSAPVAELSEGLLYALELAGQANSASAALPELLTVAHLLAADEEAVAQVLHDHEGLVQFLAAWLPRGTAGGATAAERGAATAAATALSRLTEHGAPLGARELGALLRQSASEHAEPAFRDACETAFGNAVATERDAALLAQLLATRVEEAGCFGEALQIIARQIVHLLKSSQSHHATETLFTALERVEALIPKDAVEGKDASMLLALILEARSLGSFDTALESDKGSAADTSRTSVLAATSASMFGQAGRGSADSGSLGGFAKTSPAIFAR
mmetsp:Transcript_73686/g.216221  ORF Transcript_73686/g.216221 Transcript_73686/m.216221 type:complete len:1492 (+) Transcript_73686:143-4618(+)